MRVITIEEDNHGMIGIAKTYADAVHFLVNDSWLGALTEIYCGDEVYKTVIEDLGEDWLAVILDWSMEKFCEYFEGLFYLDSVEVYEVAQSTFFNLRPAKNKKYLTIANVCDIIIIEIEVIEMKTYNNCYYCNFYIEDTCECELGYFDDSECGEWEEEDEEDEDE